MATVSTAFPPTTSGSRRSARSATISFSASTASTTSWRALRGKEYYSISKRVKARVKSAVSFVDRYEELLQELARHRRCDGIICGHIHTPQDKDVGGIHYLNSGDWVESLTAIIEHHDGRLELVRHEEFLGRLRGTAEPETMAMAI
jgi:UDP-2,3-diacylglucosamine pyrophosphatase LpxH